MANMYKSSILCYEILYLCFDPQSITCYQELSSIISTDANISQAYDFSVFFSFVPWNFVFSEIIFKIFIRENCEKDDKKVRG